MTNEGRRYVELADELKAIQATNPRYGEVVGEMDRIWWRLGELEREELEGFLIAIDEVERSGKGYPPAESDEGQPEKQVTDEAIPQWSDEVVAESFRAEICARFEAHNAAYRAREDAELEQVLREHPEKVGQSGYEVRDSFAWEVYQASEIRIDKNSVTIVLPGYYRVGIDLLRLFDHTTMAWSRPVIGATIVDGDARPTIEILLVATWTDEMDATWRKDGNDRKRVLVELFEEEVRTLDSLVVMHCVPNDVTEVLRNHLKLALEALP